MDDILGLQLFFLEYAGDMHIIALRGGKSFQYINAHQTR
jgi:hypothetical protein